MATKKNNEPENAPAPAPQPAPQPAHDHPAQGAVFSSGSSGPTDPCIDAQPIRICNWPDPNRPIPVRSTEPIDINLQGTVVGDTPVQGLWELIRVRTRGADFSAYEHFIDELLCARSRTTPKTTAALQQADLVNGAEAYEVLKVATDAFLLAQCTNALTLNPNDPIDDDSRVGGRNRDLAAALTAYLGAGRRLPYIDMIVNHLGSPQGPFCDTDLLTDHFCLIELIWSYWIEEAMLVQAINAVSLRFQNKRGPGERDPLANFETHPLRPLSHLLWGYVQDEDHRLTVARRAYEYEHEYGLSLVGRAVPKLRPADRRSNFLEAFHNLLHQASVYYDRAANLTVRPDGFPVLNALREVHLLLAEGAHNQFSGLTWTARAEMLMQMWLLSRREMREFLGGRPAVPYAEPWMGPVDSLKRLMGWPETPVTHFRDLAVHGEKILLSIRYGNWSALENESAARGWVQFWKPEIQRYIHSYQAVTGVDLSATAQTSRQINATPPSILLQQRAARQKRG